MRLFREMHAGWCAQVEQVIAVLMQKVLVRKAIDGPEKARELLQGWFIALCTRFHHHMNNLPFGTTPREGEVRTSSFD